MKTGVLVLACVLAAAGLSAGQGALNEGQGHPLKGVWIGDWGPSKATRNQILIEIDWDGKILTGTINPGPDAVKLTKADLNPAGWMVHLEAMAGTVRYVFDGKIENLGSLSRSIVGTMTQGNQKGDFKLTKQ